MGIICNVIMLSFSLILQFLFFRIVFRFLVDIVILILRRQIDGGEVLLMQLYLFVINFCFNQVKIFLIEVYFLVIDFIKFLQIYIYRLIIGSFSVQVFVMIELSYVRLLGIDNFIYVAGRSFVVGSVQLIFFTGWMELEGIFQFVLINFFYQLDIGFKIKKTSRFDFEIVIDLVQYSLGLGFKVI